MPTSGRHAGLTLLEILVAIFLVSIVALASGVLIRSLGLLGSTQFSPTRHERPARLRTQAIEYVQAELEFLRNAGYLLLRDNTVCLPGDPTSPYPAQRRIDLRMPTPGYVSAGEPRLPAVFEAADILISTESVRDYVAAPPAGQDCRPRRITIRVFLPGDTPAAIGGSGEIFARGESEISPR
ncbi:MAG: prepilin-type N-terminal cleavage/methylation domain-containing protein [Armatimonadota bacterium]|nr:prepilin-type N-terminal cleavage/methylation domain-containing protein [Armatimonadota bacterium]